MNCIKCKKEIPDGSAFCLFCGSKQEKRDHIKRANGTGSVTKRGDKYLATVSVYDPRRRRLVRSFDKKKDAVNALPALRRELLESTGRLVADQKLRTLADIYEEWSSSSAGELSKSKQTAYTIAWRRCSRVTDIPVGNISIGQLQSLLSGLSFYQARDIKSLLSHLYKRACAQGDANANLSEFLTLPKLEEKEAEPFSQEELAQLWQRYEHGDFFVAYILLMCYTGMMPGELLDAKRDMVDLENRRITGCGKKTKERKDRSILLPNVIVPVMKAILASHKYASLIGMNRDKFYDEYHAALQRAGVRDLPPYSCRHTTATVLALDDSVAPLLITRALRQATPYVTERYKHADEEQILEALDKMQKASASKDVQKYVATDVAT